MNDDRFGGQNEQFGQNDQFTDQVVGNQGPAPRRGTSINEWLIVAGVVIVVGGLVYVYLNKNGTTTMSQPTQPIPIPSKQPTGVPGTPPSSPLDPTKPAVSNVPTKPVMPVVPTKPVVPPKPVVVQTKPVVPTKPIVTVPALKPIVTRRLDAIPIVQPIQPVPKPSQPSSTVKPAAVPQTTIRSTGSSANAGLIPSKITLNGRIAYYQIPANPKGLFVVFPGCERTGYGFWPNSSKCTECAGLTEDIATTKQILARGYGILVLTAKGPSLCWQGSTDATWVQSGPIPAFLKQHTELAHKPVYLWGASSGGGMMLSYLGSMGVTIAGVVAVVATSHDPSVILKGLKGKKAPPIVWITMASPTEQHAAATNVAGWKSHAPAGMASVAVRPVTNTFFSDRDSRITTGQSAQITAELKKIGLINSGGKVVKDPKAGGHAWVSTLYKALPFLQSTLAGSSALAFPKSPILQEVFVAQAKHEHVTDYTTSAIMWFEHGAAGDFTTYATKYKVTFPSLLIVDRQTGDPTPKNAFGQ